MPGLRRGGFQLKESVKLTLEEYEAARKIARTLSKRFTTRKA